ncbi:MAG: DUF2628 domain-containing protein [Pseudomonadota bacterium]|nr:DUF2628 domain-containing protein [Pseudomonadota bacterium]
MRHYTVHVRPEADPDDVRFVKDGFSWPAFFVPVVWLVVKAHWLWLVLYLLASALIGAVVSAGNLTGDAFAVMLAALSVLAGLEANDIERRALARRGFVSRGSAAGADLEAAELQFFSTAHPADDPARPASNRTAGLPGDDLRGLA